MSRDSRTLVLLAHPDLPASRVTRALADAVRELAGVTVRDLSAVRTGTGYDVAEEQRLLVAHDTIVLQFPWFWYSVPGLLKEWMDQVLTWGFAYGSAGTALHGKTLQLVTSTGGPRASYRTGGHNRFTMAELMAPLDATAHLCGMRLADPLVVHGARVIDDDSLAAHAARYRGLLDEQLRRSA
jgi:glutathione-regulated potassium-efflux system ancillary protein KefG